uniref:Uncharacterized protein n=1 Tax=Nelumbo nucifera TaxID=4432 RepID=A0A822Z8H5_NELNU|nr:TPA_asm: hypothetical protein HUJ06_015186 [Nelumbo nucifera]
MKKPHTRKLLDRDAPDPNESLSSPRLLPDSVTNPCHRPTVAARKPMSTFDSSMALMWWCS